MVAPRSNRGRSCCRCSRRSCRCCNAGRLRDGDDCVALEQDAADAAALRAAALVRRLHLLCVVEHKVHELVKAEDHAFKAHVGADAETALVEEIAITPANVHDGKAGGEALPDNPGEVFADSAYRGETFRTAVRAKGGTPRIVATQIWGRDAQESLARLDAWNQPIHRVRSRIEKIFGTWKRSYGLRRMRWMGLAKASLQIRLTAIAYNMKRVLGILAAAA